MSIWQKNIAFPVQEPARPSHFREDQNVRDIPPVVDYPTEDVVDTAEYGYPPPLDPVPVYMVAPLPSNRPLRKGRLTTVYVDGTKATQVASADRRRTRLFMRSKSTNTQSIFLLDSALQPVSDGFELTSAGNDDVETFHNDAVWARCSTGESGYLNVINEYEVEE